MEQQHFLILGGVEAGWGLVDGVVCAGVDGVGWVSSGSVGEVTWWLGDVGRVGNGWDVVGWLYDGMRLGMVGATGWLVLVGSGEWQRIGLGISGRWCRVELS